MTPSPECNSPVPASPQPPSHPSAAKPKEGTSTDGSVPSQPVKQPSVEERPVFEPEGAVSLPLPSPALVRGPKAVELARLEGKWPVVDILVDKYAVLSDPGEGVSL